MKVSLNEYVSTGRKKSFVCICQKFHSHYEELILLDYIYFTLLKICHMFPSVMEKPAFLAWDAPIDKRNLFLLSGKDFSR